MQDSNPISPHEKNEKNELNKKIQNLEKEVALIKGKYFSLLDNLRESVAIYKAVDDGKDFVFTYFNPSGESTEKIAQKDVIGKKVTDIFPGVIEMGLFSKFQEVWKSGVSAFHPIRLYQDGRISGWRDNYVFKIPGDEIVAAYMDKTEEQRIKQDLIQSKNDLKEINEELEQRVKNRTINLVAVNKELEAFAYSVSHDLRAPLRAIDGFSLAILEDYEDKLDETGKDYLNRVRSGVQRMGDLISDILKLSRLTRTELQRTSTNLSDIAEDVITELKLVNLNREINIVIEKNVIEFCDSRLVRVILQNLLGNAWKFTHSKNNAKIEFGKTIEKNHEVYFVRDNGAGFDMAYSENLFRVFHRLHSSDEFKGNGIGLATVQRIIHKHGGEIWADGKVDQGATFYFFLQ